MKRSFQEVVELVVFGLIALLIGVGLLWLVGWVLGLVGLLMKFLAGLIWWLLRYIVPIAIVAGLIYFLVRVLQGDRSSRPAPAATAPTGVETAPAPTAPAAGSQPTSGEASAAAARHGLPDEGGDEAPAAGGESAPGSPGGDEDDSNEDDSNEDDSKHN